MDGGANISEPPTNGGNIRPTVNFNNSSTQFHGRKRFSSSSDDMIDNWSHTKLYVASIPRTALVEDIRPVFENHGRVVEVVLFRDKKTGLRQGACFVKYATLEDAQRAIQALDNQYTFHGEVAPITIRFADGEQERLGLKSRFADCNRERLSNFKTRFGDREQGRLGAPMDKLYVGSVSKLATKFDIAEIFSPYGCIEEIFIVLDERKQCRGCAFVKFSHSDMALAAINALNGTYRMSGCDQPLVVRFADPKKPRVGESRGNNAFGNPNFGPHLQEPVVRPPLNFGDSMRGHFPQAPYPMHQVPRSSQPAAVSHMAKHCPSTPGITEPNPQLQRPLANFPPMPLQQTQASQRRFHQSQHVSVSLEQTPLQHLPAVWVESAQGGNNPFSTAIRTVPTSPGTAGLLECDWSEHTCPDGHKYYYNCITCESTWDKPEEYALYEQQEQKLRQPQRSVEKHDSSLQIHSSISVPLTPQDLDRGKVQSETSAVIGPTCA